MTNTNAVTVQHGFRAMRAPDEYLFELRAGIPVTDSLQEASNFLAAVQHTLMDVADDPHPESIYGATYLVEMAKAAVDAALEGLHAQQRGVA